MPYIERERRDKIDWIIDNLASEINTSGIDKNIRYIFYKLAKNLCGRYSDFAHFEGDIRQSMREINRRLVRHSDSKFIYSYDNKYNKLRFDRLIVNLAAILKELGITGNLNYIIYRLAKKVCNNYFEFTTYKIELLKTLEFVYHNIESKYEDKKIIENGDIE